MWNTEETSLMDRVKKQYNDDEILYWQKKLLINKLRQASRFWKAKNLVLKAAKEKVKVGKFKNGKTKFKTKVKCNTCKKLFEPNQIEVNHIIPVVDIEKGFENWQTYIDRLFCKTTNLECLCHKCHSIKTVKQNKLRKNL